MTKLEVDIQYYNTVQDYMGQYNNYIRMDYYMGGITTNTIPYLSAMINLNNTESFLAISLVLDDA